MNTPTPSGALPNKPLLPGLLPGLLLAGALAAVAIWLSRLPWMVAHGLSALTASVVLGIIVGNTIYPRIATPCNAGLAVCKTRLLRLGIVLFGLRITLQGLVAVGAGALVMDILVMLSTFGLACWLGIRMLKLPAPLVMVIGAGSSICGAAAVVAATPVARASDGQAAVAVATVVVFGTVAMFLYPVLWLLADQWMTAQQFGIYIGATVHEVAQVVAAGGALGPEVASTAVITKLTRVVLLAPFLVGLSLILARLARAKDGAQGGGRFAGVAIPWFAFGFLVAVAVNSTGWLPEQAVRAAIAVGDIMLAMAMAALGISTHWAAVRQAGLRAGLLAAALFVWLVIGGGLMQLAVNHLLA